MRAIVEIWIVLTLVVVGTAAQAASFDCTKPLNVQERIICSDLHLNDQDVRMVWLHGAIGNFVLMGGSAELRDQMDEFLKQRSGCGESRQCLTRLYDNRVSEMKRTLAWWVDRCRKIHERSTTEGSGYVDKCGVVG